MNTVKSDTASAADGFVDGARGVNGDRQCFDGGGQRLQVVYPFFAQHFIKQRRFDTAETQRGFEMAGERFAAAPTERVQNLVLGAVWREIQVEGYIAVGVECFAQRTR